MQIFHLDEIKQNQQIVGGKALAIAQLFQAGFSIPNGFVLTNIIETQNNQNFARINTQAKSVITLTRKSLSIENKSLLKQTIKQLFPEDNLFAIRSSAIGEDGQDYSYAGQFKSFLNIEEKDIENKIFQVIHSVKNNKINNYQQDFKQLSTSMSVLIQPMINADIAGVVFSRDPVSGQRCVVINAIQGLGDRLMAGAVTGQSYKVNRFNQIIERPDTNPLLTKKQILEINALAYQVEAHFGMPQDIEWVIADQQLYLLQARPITTLQNISERDGFFRLWDNSNIVESYSGITTPLTFSFARKAYTEVYQQFCKIMGVSHYKIVHHQTIFKNMIGFVQGRIYYNLLNWYRVLALLPAMQLNARFMEQMMGVKEELPEEFIVEIHTLAQPNNWREKLESYGIFFSLIFNFLTLNNRIKKYYHRINQVIERETFHHLPEDIKRWQVDELMEYYCHLEQQLLTHWDAPLVNDFFAMIFYGLLRRCTEKWCDDQTDSLHNILIAGEENIVSTEPLKLMQVMANTLTSEDLSLLATGNLLSIQKWLQTQSLFKQQYNDYLEKFGDRCLSELKLESPTLRDQPLLLFRSIAQLTQISTQQKSETQNQLREQAKQTVFTTLKYNPIRKTLFKWILKQTRRLVSNRENLRFERTRVFGLARCIFLQLGQNLFNIKKLHAPEDIFYLEVEEIIGYVNGTSTCQNLRGLVALRRAEHEQYQQDSKPDNRFLTYGIPYHANTFQKLQMQLEKNQSITYQGQSCAVGHVRGEVRVVRNPQQFLEREATKTKAGYILVAESTDPGWILLFPYAAGLLVERGSMLSHVAIVCRELGLPMITALTGITQNVQDGDWVEIDGKTGQVYRLEREAIPLSNS